VRHAENILTFTKIH